MIAPIRTGFAASLRKFGIEALETSDDTISVETDWSATKEELRAEISRLRGLLGSSS